MMTVGKRTIVFSFGEIHSKQFRNLFQTFQNLIQNNLAIYLFQCCHRRRRQHRYEWVCGLGSKSSNIHKYVDVLVPKIERIKYRIKN